MTEEVNEKKIETTDNEAQHVSFDGIKTIDDAEEKRKP